MMFSAFCPTHDARVLMTRRNAIGFFNGPEGPVIRWRCTCGHEGFLDHTGSHADPTNTTCETEAPIPMGPIASEPADHVTVG